MERMINEAIAYDSRLELRVAPTETSFAIQSRSGRDLERFAIDSPAELDELLDCIEKATDSAFAGEPTRLVESVTITRKGRLYRRVEVHATPTGGGYATVSLFVYGPRGGMRSWTLGDSPTLLRLFVEAARRQAGALF